MRKKIFILVLALATINVSFALNLPIEKPRLKASEIMIPIGLKGEKISLLELSKISVKDVQDISGRKMKFADKLVFKAAQKKLRQNINPDGTINSKKIEKAYKKAKGGESGFHLGGFALGFLLGLIGVLIAYLINDGYKSNRVKWSWIGFLIALAISLAFII